MPRSSRTSTSGDIHTRRRVRGWLGMLACSLGVLQACRGDVSQAPERVTLPASAGPARVTADRDTVQFGGEVVLTGAWLPADTAGLRAELGMAAARIDSLAGERLWLRLPTGVAPCDDTLDTLRLSGAGWSIRLPVVVGAAWRTSLATGEAVSVAADADGACLDLRSPAGVAARYVLTVMNPVGDAAHTAAYSLRGIGLGSLSARHTSVHRDASLLGNGGLGAGVVTAGGTLPAAGGGMATSARYAVSATDALTALPAETRHFALLNRALPPPMGDVGAGDARAASVASAATVGGRPMAAAMTSGAGQVGDIVDRRVATGSCALGTRIRARVVYRSATALLLEDVAAPQAGGMDALLEQLGDEFERVMLPLVRRSMGNPLAHNAVLDRDGRVTVLLTPVVNQAMPGTAAFVNACDLYPQTVMPGSSADEVVYLRVPSATERPGDWHRSVRSTLVHETKHLASFAERLARGREFEEPWLEEATARVAEELYSRTFRGGGAWLGGTTFASSVACELSGCDERPLVMYKHFAVLHQYLRDPGTRSPLGATSADDVTPYASGWSLLRTALDGAAVDESALLQALVQGDAGRGISALAQLTGQSTVALLDAWTASLVEAETGAASVSGRRSWDTGSMWRGLSTLFPTVFRRAPLKATYAEAGNWQLSGATVRGFSAAYTLLEGATGGTQRIELRSAHGQTLHFRVTRVQ